MKCTTAKYCPFENLLTVAHYPHKLENAHRKKIGPPVIACVIITFNNISHLLFHLDQPYRFTPRYTEVTVVSNFFRLAILKTMRTNRTEQSTEVWKDTYIQMGVTFPNI